MRYPGSQVYHGVHSTALRRYIDVKFDYLEGVRACMIALPVWLHSSLINR